MRLIDADVLLEELNSLEPRCANKYVKQGIDDGLHYYMPKILGEQPTVDAVPVVRCKSCIHAKWSEQNKAYYCRRRWAMHKVRDRDFCSYGERKEADGDG